MVISGEISWKFIEKIQRRTGKDYFISWVNNGQNPAREVQQPFAETHGESGHRREQDSH